MKERPVLMSTPMVAAEKEGRKTETRRIKGLDIINDAPDQVAFENFILVDGILYARFSDILDSIIRIKCPYGQPGDVLWVRETFVAGQEMDANEYFISDKDGGFVDKIWYRADGDLDCWFNGTEMVETIPWKPSIFMPKKACRTFLEITSIGIERLQDISQADIISEGIRYPVNAENNNILFRMGEENAAYEFMPEGFSLNQKHSIPWTEKDLLFAHWAELWCSLHGRESWNKNPWVWVIKFKRTSNV